MVIPAETCRSEKGHLPVRWSGVLIGHRPTVVPSAAHPPDMLHWTWSFAPLSSSTDTAKADIAGVEEVASNADTPLHPDWPPDYRWTWRIPVTKTTASGACKATAIPTTVSACYRNAFGDSSRIKTYLYDTPFNENTSRYVWTSTNFIQMCIRYDDKQRYTA